MWHQSLCLWAIYRWIQVPSILEYCMVYYASWNWTVLVFSCCFLFFFSIEKTAFERVKRVWNNAKLIPVVLRGKEIFFLFHSLLIASVMMMLMPLKKVLHESKKENMTKVTEWLANIDMVIDKMYFRNHVDKWYKANCNPYEQFASGMV